jgi:O-antigen ligase
MLVVPISSVFVIWSFWKTISTKLKLTIILLTILAIFGIFQNSEIQTRFEQIGKTNQSNAVRLNHWKQGWEIFKQHPILGAGPNSIPNAQPIAGDNEKERKKYYHAHQIFITVLAESGILGLLAFLALHLAPFKLLWPHKRSKDPQILFWVCAASVVTIQLFINGLTDNVFSLKPLMYIYWTVTAAALWLVTVKKNGLFTFNS